MENDKTNITIDNLQRWKTGSSISHLDNLLTKSFMKQYYEEGSEEYNRLQDVQLNSISKIKNTGYDKMKNVVSNVEYEEVKDDLTVSEFKSILNLEVNYIPFITLLKKMNNGSLGNEFKDFKNSLLKKDNDQFVHKIGFIIDADDNYGIDTFQLESYQENLNEVKEKEELMKKRAKSYEERQKQMIEANKKRKQKKEELEKIKQQMIEQEKLKEKQEEELTAYIKAFNHVQKENNVSAKFLAIYGF